MTKANRKLLLTIRDKTLVRFRKENMKYFPSRVKQEHRKIFNERERQRGNNYGAKPDCALVAFIERIPL